MTFRSSAVSSPLRFRSRFPLTSLALAAVVATLAACAQTPAGPQASQASPAIATTPAPAPAPAQPAAPQPLPAAGLSPSEEQIVPRQYANNPKVDAFINEVAARDGLDPARLRALFATANYSATAVKLVRPAPSPSVKNWRVYQSRFLDTIRINAGVKFWRANQATLQRASAEFGVPPEVIVGIIGVETIYGRYMGNFPALDALTTLAFDYPDTPNRADRQATFRKNLEDFLVWTRDSQIDPTSVVGSYTGAIGIPQFLPSSIRAYAVDYEGNGHIDLRASTADAIGSVANYLKQHGWQPGRPVVWEIAPDAGSQGVAQAAADGKPEPHLSLSQLTQAGLTLDEPSVDVRAEASTPVTVVDLPSPNRATEYKLGLQNFYVLTRYNRSFFYALAVYQLGERVKQKMLATQ
ncbi:lytic murein transglycosylase B [Burkholderia gladioli pv. gladioli]|uniref:lytic murein transglycosylase B n=1 Tax=Burkholderia gladioli TaxID=28095 RepID=UPI0024BCB120|nr:lytic murein transglycosylase B [Burkholderia gladioli]MDJ1162566.1 lytic murein transglycosylase B [Burkholderia gladioli pv. gladioli]